VHSSILHFSQAARQSHQFQSTGNSPKPVRAGRDSRNGTLWNVVTAVPDHSGLMPANFTTLAHFSVSSAISFPNAAGVIDIGSAPKSASRAFSLGSARAALISLLSFSTISEGVLYLPSREEDTKRSLDWWVDQCEDWLKAQGYYPTRPATQSFVAARIAMGDIAFSDPSRFPSMSLGITALPQFEALPGRWKGVLASNQAPWPVQQR
jgi:hypothetical protein